MAQQASVAPIQPLAWELTGAGAALKKKKKRERERERPAPIETEESKRHGGM